MYLGRVFFLQSLVAIFFHRETEAIPQRSSFLSWLFNTMELMKYKIVQLQIGMIWNGNDTLTKCKKLARGMGI